jgi:TonB family protein
MSVTASMALHVGGLFLFLQAGRIASKAPVINIEDVDLRFVAPKTPIPVVPHAAAPKPTSMMDLMKMTLPAVPKPAALRPVDIKLPEIQHALLPATPKLDERTRLQQPKLQTLSLDNRRVSAARIDAPLQEHHAAALADLQRAPLEDLGVHRVKNLVQAQALEDRRREAVALQGIQAPMISSAHRAVAPEAVLQEATPQQSSSLGRAITNFLPTAPEPLGLQPQGVAPAPVIHRIDTPPPAAPKHTAALQAEKKNAVSIEGQLVGRKVVSRDVPQFPDWAKQQNILEAEVVIHFNVDPDGNVLPDMSIESTSSYGRLDRLCMDALRNWKFAPTDTGQNQWGRITFRFILE